jgi:hypothetical protein
VSLAPLLKASIAIATRDKAAKQLADAHADVLRAESVCSIHRHGPRSLDADDNHRRALERFHELAVVALNLGDSHGS